MAKSQRVGKEWFKLERRFLGRGANTWCSVRKDRYHREMREQAKRDCRWQ